LDKDYFCNWLQAKINEVLEFKPKDDMNKSYILGAASAMSEILKQSIDGKFDIK
jgi:hypothetical protein